MQMGYFTTLHFKIAIAEHMLFISDFVPLFQVLMFSYY